MSFKSNLLDIQKTIPFHVTLIAVSKNQSVAAIEELYEAGQRDFGENKIQELCEKDLATQHLPDLKWHMIGQIQTNKLKKLLSINRLKYIHSIDRIELANTILKYQINHSIGLFWELNLSEDENKHGFKNFETLEAALLQFPQSPFFYHMGLMCMGPQIDDENLSHTRRVFEKMNKIKVTTARTLESKFLQGFKLSMGMSNDYQLAIECGSDYVRVGSKLFVK